eukprot:TRINITY_DN10977_c0_g1_i1.p1 TRINITY_DN10977_c0_g1~~TRINITY_DN10977_c0_g1_i1.p1  ORF type:complete len:276 (-),score=21.37 TRINITY_DN10977_c0_g1_i1:19-801(-)
MAYKSRALSLGLLRRFVSRPAPLLLRSFSSSPDSTNNGYRLPLSCSQKTFLTAGSAFLAFFNPWRGDMIAVLSEVTGERSLNSMLEKMKGSEEGREILRLKPRIRSSTVDPDRLLQLPQDTFGYQYAKFMSAQGFSPDDRAEVRFLDDPDLAYVLQRYRECHDLWHVLCGLPTSVLGELAQKWFELLQTGLPMCALSSFVGPLRLPISDQIILVRDYIPWAIKCNRSCKFLMSVQYEELFEKNIDMVRQELGIVLPEFAK